MWNSEKDSIANTELQSYSPRVFSMHDQQKSVPSIFWYSKLSISPNTTIKKICSIRKILIPASLIVWSSKVVGFMKWTLSPIIFGMTSETEIFPWVHFNQTAKIVMTRRMDRILFTTEVRNCVQFRRKIDKQNNKINNSWGKNNTEVNHCYIREETRFIIKVLNKIKERQFSIIHFVFFLCL